MIFDANPWDLQAGQYYNYFLELASLIILTAICVCYFTRKKFPTPIFKLFGVILIVVTTGTFLNVFSCVAIEHGSEVPLWITYTLHGLYYISQCLISYLLFAYVFYSLGKSIKRKPIYLLTMIPSTIAILLLVTNGLHHWLFTIEELPNGLVVLKHGPLFFSFFVVTILNVGSTVAYTITFRKRLPRRFALVFLSIVGITMVTTIIERFQPRYILTGLGYTLSIMFVIITINDPDDKVDKVSGAFNNDAFIDYINTQFFEKQNKYYVFFSVESLGRIASTYGPLYFNELLVAIRKFVMSCNKNCYLFKTQSTRFVALFKTREEQMVFIHKLQERLRDPFIVRSKEFYLSVLMFFFYNDGVFKSSDAYNKFLNQVNHNIDYKDQKIVELDTAFLESLSRKRKIKEILEECLKKKEGFYMVYQPIYDVEKKVFNHFEALLRLDNYDLGYIGPAEFVPIAESYGLATQIDYYVLNETCAFLKRHPQIESLEINVSCSEFFDNPSEKFLSVIEKYGIDPKRICLEITETVAVKYPTKTKQFMEDLGKYGVKFAMDDFGSGYSNMARFITMPFSIAKLDKSLLGEEKNIRIFLDHAIELFKSLDIPIVIEGVEVEKQLKLAHEKAINFIQGYYFSKPLLEPDLIRFIKKHNK